MLENLSPIASVPSTVIKAPFLPILSGLMIGNTVLTISFLRYVPALTFT